MKLRRDDTNACMDIDIPVDGFQTLVSFLGGFFILTLIIIIIIIHKFVIMIIIIHKLVIMIIIIAIIIFCHYLIIIYLVIRKSVTELLVIDPFLPETEVEHRERGITGHLNIRVTKCEICKKKMMTARKFFEGGSESGFYYWNLIPTSGK